MAPRHQKPVLIFMVLSFLLASSQISEETEVSVQIVYMANSKNTAASHIQTLASVLGSEMAAKKAIIYDYTRIINGFAAKLTADQIAALLKQPAVLKILPADIIDQNSAVGVSSSSSASIP